MPNVGGKEYPYTPAGMAAAKRARAALGAQVTDTERRRLAKGVDPMARQVLGAQRTAAERNALRNKLKMNKRPTSASPLEFGEFKTLPMHILESFNETDDY